MRSSTQQQLVRSLVFAIALLLPQVAGAQSDSWSENSWWVRLRTTGYAYQEAGPAGTEEDRFGFYQHFDGSLSGLFDDRLSLRISGRFADDLVLKERVNVREKLYTAYAQLRLGWNGQARLGRQFLHEGPTSLLLDGAWISVAPFQRWEIHGWAGGASPASRNYELAEFSDDVAVGARVKYRAARRVQVSGSWGYREAGGITDAQPVGAEATATLFPWMRVRADYSYETEQKLVERAGFLAQLHRRGLPTLSLQYLDRRPQIGGSSYFARFDDLERIRISRASLNYHHDSGLGAEADYFGSFVDSRNSSRVGGALSYRFIRAGYSTRVGDTGEDDRWYGDLNFQLLNWLRLQGGATLTTYSLVEQQTAEYDRDLITAFGRVRADLRPGLRFSAEVQTLDNPEYESDTRLLLGLDLSMGRGASSFGLGQGGWFE